MEEKVVSNIQEALSFYDCALVNEKAAKEFLEGDKFKSAYEQNMKSEQKKKKCIQSMDITSLHTEDTDEGIEKFVEKVNEGYGKYGYPSAICVYPSKVRKVKSTLKAPGVKIAAVSGGFPHAQTFMEVKIAETSLCLLEGADEIDMVLSVGNFLEGELTSCSDEIREMKDCVGEKTLKVILETCLLPTPELISEASLLAMISGADFIKTSTGKDKEGATMVSSWAMCKSIRQYFERTGEKVGFKAAGGIRKMEDAMKYLTLVEMLLGEEWITEEKFRIGTSGLSFF